MKEEVAMEISTHLHKSPSQISAHEKTWKTKKYRGAYYKMRSCFHFVSLLSY